MARRSYGFQYADLSDTTTTRTVWSKRKKHRVEISCIAGNLYAFANKALRDSWVEDCPSEEEQRGHRVAVSVATLKAMGWSVECAQQVGEISTDKRRDSLGGHRFSLYLLDEVYAWLGAGTGRDSASRKVQDLLDKAMANKAPPYPRKKVLGATRRTVRISEAHLKWLQSHDNSIEAQLRGLVMSAWLA